MSRVAGKLLESGVFVMAVGDCVFGYVVEGKIGWANLLALCISVVWMAYLWILPRGWE